MNAINLRVLAALSFTLLMMTSCSKPEEASIESLEIVQFYDYSETEEETLELINRYRDSVGLNKLDKINHISYKSSEHNEYMIENKDVSHANFEKREANMHTALGAVKVGENIAFNFSSPELAVKAWLKSEKHKMNLEGDYTHFGISIRENERGQTFYTNIFIKK